MAKEIKYGIGKEPVFRETFNSSQDVANNGGSITDVTFYKSEGYFNGTTSFIDYFMNLNGIYSIRFKLNFNDSVANHYLMDFKGENNNGVGWVNIVLDALNSSTGTEYVNGIQSQDLTGLTGKKVECAITGITINSKDVQIGHRGTGSLFFDGSFDLVEIFEGTLTSDEIKNLYNNSRHVLNPKSPTFLLSAVAGINEKLRRSYTFLDVAIKHYGQMNGIMFNGTTSYIDFGSDFIGTGDITVHIWLKPNSFGQNGFGRVISNSYFVITTNTTNKNFIVNSNGPGGGTASYPTNSLILDKVQCLSLTRDSSGLVTGYLDNELLLPSSTSGTPGTDGSNVIIGNRDAFDRAYDGLIFEFAIYDYLMDAEGISRYYNSTKFKYTG